MCRPVCFVLVVIVCVGLPLQAQDQSWYAECPPCRAHLGGNDKMGPFKTKDDCESARRKELAHNFPYEACKSSGSAGTAVQDPNASLTQLLAKAIVSGNPQTRNAGIAGVGALFVLNALLSRKPAPVPPPASLSVNSGPPPETSQQRWERSMAELRNSLKIAGPPAETLKGDASANQGLSLKGLNTMASLGDLHLKLGDDTTQSYGIPGLPGIYTGGSRNAAENPGLAESGLKGLPDATFGGGQPLALKLDMAAQPPAPTASPAAQSAPGTAESPVASARTDQPGQNAAPAAQSEAALPKTSGALTDAGRIQQEPVNALAGAKSDEDVSEQARKQFENTSPVVVINRTPPPPANAVVPAPASVPDHRPVAEEPRAANPRAVERKEATAASIGVSNNSSPGHEPETSLAPPARTLTAALSPGHMDGFAAPGAPIFDCDGDRRTLDRFLAGRDSQKQALDRTEAALNSADADYDKAWREARWAAVKTLIDASIGIVQRAETLIARAQMMKNTPGTPAAVAARWKLLQRAKAVLEAGKEIQDAIDRPEKLRKAYDAGLAYGDTTLVRHAASNFKAQSEELYRLIKDSGILEEQLSDVGKYAATSLGGPVGLAAFETATDTIDLVGHVYSSVHSAEEADALRRALETMRSQYSQVGSRIYELQDEMRTNCNLGR